MKISKTGDRWSKRHGNLNKRRAAAVTQRVLNGQTMVKVATDWKITPVMVRQIVHRECMLLDPKTYEKGVQESESGRPYMKFLCKHKDKFLGR